MARLVRFEKKIIALVASLLILVYSVEFALSPSLEYEGIEWILSYGQKV